MDNCFLIVNKIAKNKAKDHISLSYDERFLRRKKLVSDNGFEFLVNLPETKSLSENQAFRLQSGNLILICLLYTSPSPRDKRQSRMPSSA